MRDREGVAAVDILLVILAMIAAVVGGLTMSQVTAGVGIIAGACLLAILARMVQAHHHHSAILAALRTPPPRAETSPPPAPDIGTWLCFRCGQHVGGKFDDCTACGLARPHA
jgi:hypothetical protein